MFVTVTKDGRSFHKVTDAVYNKRMKKLGYCIVSDMPEKTEELKEEVKEVATIEEPEIPISDMSKEELAEFARENGIDTSGATNVRQARTIISAAIAKSKK